MGLGPVLDYWRGRAGKPEPAVRDWTQAELAQFYRVEWALSQAGISVETDRGLSDEGDPWFAFCRASDAEVVIHIAREGEVYLLAGFLSDRIQRGRDFGHLVERLLAEHPAKAIDRRSESNVVMHPATLLALLVSIAFLQGNEGKAETVSEHADDTSSLRAASAPLPVNTGINLRSTTALTGSIVALAATFELAQAMTILRVANLMNEAPAEQDGDNHFGAAIDKASDSGWAVQNKRGPAPDSVGAVQHHANEAHASSALDMLSTSLPAAQASIEHLLEIVAKLWTFPDAGAVMVNGLGVSAALAFFAGTANGSDDLSIALRAHQQARSTGETASASGAVQQAATTDQVPPGSTLTIIQTSGSSDSIAQTMLKLSFSGQGEVTINAETLADTGKLFSVVSELVAHAKGDVSLGQGSIALSLGHAEIEVRSPAGLAHVDTPSLDLAPQADDKVEVRPVSDKGAIAESYTTVIRDGVIKHDVLNSYGQASAERAIAAFKEDVGHYSIGVTGRDVIFLSHDVQEGSLPPDVVVELWQFKDGSSIALVGLSVDGYLPYWL